MVKNGQVEIISNDQGYRTTPSYVSFTDKERLVGNSAKSSAANNPLNTVHDAKRLIGRPFDDSYVQRDMKNLAYKIVNKDNKPMIQVNYKEEVKTFSPEEISAAVLQKMKVTIKHFIL